MLFQFSLSCLKHLQVSPLVRSGTFIPPIYIWTLFSSCVLFSLPIDGIFQIFSPFFLFLSILKMVIKGKLASLTEVSSSDDLGNVPLYSQ